MMSFGQIMIWQTAAFTEEWNLYTACKKVGAGWDYGH